MMYDYYNIIYSSSKYKYNMVLPDMSFLSTLISFNGHYVHITITSRFTALDHTYSQFPSGWKGYNTQIHT